VDEAVAQLAHLPFSDIGSAKVDHHRALRCGFAEAVFGSGKRTPDLLRIVADALSGAPCILATRVDRQQAAALRKQFKGAVYNEAARTVRVGKPVPIVTNAEVAVVTAGTSDIPVAEEAMETLQAFGCPARKFYDVGVAGLHRMLGVLPELRRAASVICVAGMEGALPSVVGGLVPCPVIAVPTSVGYGCSMNGLAALLAMLNSCASGVSVVNIDNGFGAAMCALRMMNAARSGGSRHTEHRVAKGGR
jgi:NCAIR mutase (PurE)-related protein